MAGDSQIHHTKVTFKILHRALDMICEQMTSFHLFSGDTDITVSYMKGGKA